MHPSIRIILLIVCAVWIASELLLILFRRSSAKGTSRDSGSILWLNAIIYGSVAVAVFVGFSDVGLIHRFRLPLAWIGLFFILLGLTIRWSAIFTLRRFFTVNVAIQPNHRIIRNGLYGCIRHPSYSGTIISFFGLGLAQSNWITFVLLIVPITYAFIRRIEIEECVLLEEFGSQYNEYVRTTWQLIPWIY